jgi:hypothetical protein
MHLIQDAAERLLAPDIERIPRAANSLFILGGELATTNPSTASPSPPPPDTSAASPPTLLPRSCSPTNSPT